VLPKSKTADRHHLNPLYIDETVPDLTADWCYRRSDLPIKLTLLSQHWGGTPGSDLHQNKGDSFEGEERLKGCRGKWKRPQNNSDKTLCEKRQSAVTVELDLVDPIAGPSESDTLCVLGSTKSGRGQEPGSPEVWQRRFPDDSIWPAQSLATDFFCACTSVSPVNG
jgi:hypothetical protein